MSEVMEVRMDEGNGREGKEQEESGFDREGAFA